jgi:hypothetical protein
MLCLKKLALTALFALVAILPAIADDKPVVSPLTITYHALFSPDATERFDTAFELAVGSSPFARVEIHAKPSDETAIESVRIRGEGTPLRLGELSFRAASIMPKQEQAVSCTDAQSSWSLMVSFSGYEVKKATTDEIILEPRQGAKSPVRMSADLFHGDKYHSEIWATGGNAPKLAKSPAPVELEECRTVVPAYDTDCNHLTIASRLRMGGKTLFEYRASGAPDCYSVFLLDPIMEKKTSSNSVFTSMVHGSKFSVILTTNANFRRVSNNTVEIPLDYKKGQYFGFDLEWNSSPNSRIYLGGVSPWVICR